ncbi:DUF5134 domain-containing protein [Streptomyces sp. APSN-46.1]|nr:DUF5134 domain-containing protein [Streptomyces sp. APSN-46.1]MCJ1676885.1 DUF5134 domain-containing protein [Streptomyces sp. APSN-46.1]
MSLSASVSSWLLVLLCAVSGAYCLGRVRRSGGAAGGEALMGFGMAVMAAPLGIGDGWRAPVLGAVFCGAALHAVWLLRDGAHHAHHVVGSLAMVYMALGSGSGSGHEGHGGHGAGLPLVTGTLLVYYAGYVLLGGARLATAGGRDGQGVHGDPAEVIRACRLAMGTGMLAMLLTM